MEAEIDKNEDESRKDLPKGRRASTRTGPGSNLLPLISAAHSIGWLTANYEYHHEALVKREALKDAFAAYCATRGLRPRTCALGKIIKAVFPKVGSRRLGKRGKNKMYYLHLKAKAQPPGEGVEKPYTRRRKGDDLPFLNSPVPRSVILTWGPEDIEGRQPERSKRKRSSETGPVLAMIPARPRSRTRLPSTDAHLAFDARVRQLRDTFRREFWALAQINPASTKSRLIQTVFIDSDCERSPLSFSCLVMLSIANFFSENWDDSLALLQQARLHLESVFDQTDFDVACALVPFTWFFLFFTDQAEQGHYYATLGMTMCEQLGALNDPTYIRLNWLNFFGASEEDMDPIVARTNKHPAYKRNWKSLKNEIKQATVFVHMELSKVDGVLYHSIDCLAEKNLSEEYRRTIYGRLSDQLAVLADMEAAIAHARATERPTADMAYDMLLCQLLGQRALIVSLLDYPRRLEAAEKYIRTLLRVPKPAMLIALRTRPRNDLLLSNAFRVLIWHNRLRPLQKLLAVLKPFAKLFAWSQSLRAGIKLAMSMALVTVPAISPTMPPSDSSSGPSSSSSSSSSSSLSTPLLTQPPAPSPSSSPNAWDREYVDQFESFLDGAAVVEGDDGTPVLATDSDLRSYLPSYPVASLRMSAAQHYDETDHHWWDYGLHGATP